MIWFFYIVYFFAGAFIANSLPHLFNGVSGRKFQSPFASPPGQGLSSPLINVIWGAANLLVGYIILATTGRFSEAFIISSISFIFGALIIALFSSVHFGKYNSK